MSNREKLQAQIAAYVEREVAKAPPLSQEQMAVIARALHRG